MEGLEDELVFQKVQPRRFPSQQQIQHRDGVYWKRFRIQTTRQTGAISWLDFDPVFPHRLAATSGTRVVLYDAEPFREVHALSQFKDLAHSGSYRQDGRLLIAGGEDGTVKVFNVGDRTVLRQFEGHKRPVHVAQFSTNGVQAVTGADDATVRLWDLSDGKQVRRLDGHRDYVRAGRQSLTTVDVWATGGYDHVCRVWDVRQREATMELDHGAPVEAVAFLPSGTLVVTAGGPYLCVWDVLATGRLLRKLESHHKTVTAVSNVAMSEGPRLASASLDQHVKFYDLTEFKVVHTARYKHPVLSFAVTPDGRSYAVGMADGTIVLRDNRQRDFTPAPPPTEPEPATEVISRKKPRLSQFDKLLSKFRYRDVLDAVLKERDIHQVSAVIEELAARGGLVAALSGRTGDDLVSLLTYIDAHLGNPVFTPHVTPLLELLLDIYESELAVAPLDKKLSCILRSLQREVSLLVEMKELKGTIEAVLGVK